MKKEKAEGDVTRFFERLADFTKALAKLEEALREDPTEIVRDASLQRFEFCFELAWKTLRLFLRIRQVQVAGPRDTLREALSLGILKDGNVWTELHEMRNLTVHTYDEALAERVYVFVKSKGFRALRDLETEVRDLVEKP